jgi:caspase domain-containing protein
VSAVLTALFALVASAAGAEEPPRLYGLVIGYNRSDDPSVPPLRYADDDAVKNAELLAELGAEVVLLSELDRESAELYPAVKASPPTKGALFAALDELDARIDRAKAEGRATALMIFYSGHGDVKNNEGFIHLADARLHRSDFRDLVAKAHADTVHVIVDACKSYFLVFERGAGGERFRVSPAFAEYQAELPPRVGLLLSTSSNQDSHEWEAFQSGVFSHEVRSALRGAADADNDGRVSYEEAAAFVFGANRAIPNARYRPRFFSRAPAANDPLVQLRGRRGSRLAVMPGKTGHIYVEDVAGNRIIDFHPSEEMPVEVVIPDRRPLFVRRAGADLEYEVEEPGSVALARLSSHPITSQARGAEHAAFGALFALPFERATLEAYRDETRATAIEAEAKSTPEWPRPALGVLGLALGAAGGVLTGIAINARHGVGPMTSNLDRVDVNGRIDRLNAGAITLYGLSAAAIAGYAIWTLWPEDQPQIRVTEPSDEGSEP